MHAFARPYVSGAIILLFAVLCAVGAGKPFHLDNMDFPAVAEQTAATGIPVYYRGEERPHWVGLYHPPLYIYTLALWMRVFGSGEAAVRMFGMSCAVLHGLVVLAMVGTLFGAAVKTRWGPVFWAIFLLNPYTVQTSGIADIDSTIYGPLLCLALLAALRICWRDGEWRTDAPGRLEYAAVGLAIFLCLWAKMTTVLLLLPFVFFLWIARLGVWRAAVTTGAVAGASAAAFMASYLLYGAATGMDAGYTFAFTLESFTARGVTVREQWNNVTFMAPFMLSWTGLLPWVAVCGALAIALRSAIGARDRRMLHYGLILALATLSTVYYCSKIATFGSAPYKYSFVYWGWMLTAPLLIVERSGWWIEVKWRWSALAAAALLCAVWSAAFLRDALMLDGFHGPYRWVAYVPGLLFAAGFLRSRYTKPLTAAALCLYCGVQLGIAAYQVKAPYATTYDYGQTGFMDTVGFLRSNTGPEDVIASMKDIGYRARRRYYETYAALYLGGESAERLMTAVSSGRVVYLVFTEGRGQDQLSVNPALRDWVLKHSRLVRWFGNYRIYRPVVDAGRTERLRG